MLCTSLTFGVGVLLRSDSKVVCPGIGSDQLSSFSLIPLTFYICFSLSCRRKKARLFRIGLSCIWSRCATS